MYNRLALVTPYPLFQAEVVVDLYRPGFQPLLSEADANVLG